MAEERAGVVRRSRRQEGRELEEVKYWKSLEDWVEKCEVEGDKGWRGFEREGRTVVEGRGRLVSSSKYSGRGRQRMAELTSLANPGPVRTILV